MNISPNNDLLIVRQIKDEQPVSAGGILLPPSEEAQDSPYQGIVLAAGPGKPCALQPAATEVVSALESLIEACNSFAAIGHGMANASAKASLANAQEALDRHRQLVPRIPMNVKIGDRIIFSRHGFQTFRVDGEDLIVFGEASVIGILD